jgi:tetratricopeptide (TPR) repeat protein
MRVAAWLGVLALSGGCVSQPFRGPEAGGGRWIEARSPHFRVLTSQSDDSVRESLQELEVSYAALEQVAFPSSDNPRGKTEIILLPEADFRLLVAKRPNGENLAGFFTSAEQHNDGHPRLVVKEGAGSHTLRLLQHELTHRFVAFHFPNAPVWLNEGLAQFWESMEVRHGTLAFGGTVSTIVKPTRFQNLLGLRGSDFYRGDEFDVHANYVAAEALTYVLYFQRRDAFQSYLNQLKSGAEASGAWTEAFGPQSPELENDYYGFFNERGTLATLPAPSVTAPVDVEELSPSDVHTSWASLFQNEQASEQAYEHAALAVRLDPLSADALIMRARVEMSSKRLAEARADLERAMALEPPRPNALSAALRFSLWTGEKLSVSRRELAERLRRFPLTAPQLALIAEHLRRQGDFGRGLLLISRAIAADSSCYYCYGIGADLLADKGELGAAAATLKVALSLAGERATPRDWRNLRQLEAAAARQARGED